MLMEKRSSQMLKKENGKQDAKVEKIKFFSDMPIAADREQDVRFGHLGIADNLREIILQCPLPFTIGLFGRWGSGKTTIINILKKKLQDNKIAVVKFDVWKHEKDSLRRAFLEELVKQSKSSKYLPKDFELSTRLKTPVRRTISGKFTWNWKVGLLLLGLIILAIVVGVILNNKYPGALGTYLSIISGGSLISVLFLWILQQTITSETLTTTLEPFKDPYEFEGEFERIVRKTFTKRLVIVVDNLERCTHNRAVELLSTIKTFLAKDTDVSENNKCIFLIACDDEAIKKHIESVYTKMHGKEGAMESFSADEFLRKFFNVFLRIPDFIDTELQTYTKDLLEETDISQFDSSDVAYVITNAFRENPRQIKQFINTLLAHFILAQERESGQEPLIIPKGTITNNIAFLAKFLIIRQKFHSEYQQIRESHLTIKEMEDIGDKEFKDFLRATKLIIADDIRPFIYLKQSKEELAIPGIRELELGLIDDKRDMVKEKLKVIKDNPGQVNSLKKFMPSLIERNISRRIPLINITSCSLEAFRYHNLEMGQEFYDKIADLFNDDKTLKPELGRFDTSLIFEEILIRCNEEDRNGIVAQYVDILSEQKANKKESNISIDYAYGLLKELAKRKDWLKSKKKNVQQCLTEVYYSSLRILSLFKDSIEDQKDFISEETISKFVSTFSNDDVENKQSINDKVELLLRFKEVITPEVAQNIVTSLQNLLKNENQKAYREEKENLLDRIGDIFDILYKQIVNILDKALLNSFADTVAQGMNALGNWNHKKIFVFTCLKIVDMLEGSWKTNINTQIQNFFTNADIDNIKFIFDKLNKESKDELIERYKGVFQQRVMQQQPIFDLFYLLAPQDIRIQWIVGLITSYPQRALAKLKDLKHEVDDKRKVAEALLQSAQRVAIQEKGGLYEAVNEMKCANDAELRNNLVSQIKSLLDNTDSNQQQVGYSALQGATTHISATAKREIARETVEWLRSLESASAGQPYSIKSVILNWDILEAPVQSDYIDFVFDKLIKRGVSVDNISSGFEILLKINPKYEDYSVYFDDVFARVEIEGNEQIKAELKSGLLKLKPKKTNDKNKDFWESLEKLSNKKE